MEIKKDVAEGTGRPSCRFVGREGVRGYRRYTKGA